MVTDSLGTASSPATVNVSFNDVALIANAGSNQSAMIRGTVTLNGSKSTDTDGEPLSYKWFLVSGSERQQGGDFKSNSTNRFFCAGSARHVCGAAHCQRRLSQQPPCNSRDCGSEPADIVGSLVAQIQERQGVIGTLPDDAFKFKGSRALISLELNAVLLSVEKHDYGFALLLIQGILAQADGCATIGRPDNNDLITNCPDQSEFYPALLNIAAEVRALVPPGQ